MTPCMRWQGTKLDMAKHLRAYLTDTLVKKKCRKINRLESFQEDELEITCPLFCVKKVEEKCTFLPFYSLYIIKVYLQKSVLFYKEILHHKASNYKG